MFNNPKAVFTHLRVIQTARDESSINQAVKDGFFPLMRKVRVS